MKFVHETPVYKLINIPFGGFFSLFLVWGSVKTSTLLIIATFKWSPVTWNCWERREGKGCTEVEGEKVVKVTDLRILVMIIIEILLSF